MAGDPTAAPGDQPGGPSECDVVMKGGIASGVIYPALVVELAKRYRLRNVGGTSAGAIAAAAAAAAEHGRRTGRGTQFKGLEALPTWLGSDGHLLALFQPDPPYRPVFQILLAALGPSKLLGVPAAAIAGFPIWAFGFAALGAALGIVPAVIDGKAGLVVAAAFHLLIALVLAVVGALVGAAWATARSIKTLPNNFYGLCSGFDRDGGTDQRPLTNWLAHVLDEMAGTDDHALTFGDLWTAGGTSADRAHLRDHPGERSINLQVITTSLTQGRPYSLPFETRMFYFDPAEWRRLFPGAVVDWMVAHERPLDPHDDPKQVLSEAGATLRRLPLAEDMPVVVAARMSLSFPILFAAVPLHAVDYSLAENQAAKKAGQAVRAGRCWFSDGGICSNFPIHFFDAPLPTRPTFGVTLEPYPPDEPKEDIWLPKGRNQGWLESWTRIDRGLPGFCGAILNAMQNWRDNTLAHLPAYRDRVVHIRQAPDEGGMNLEMSDAIIARLGDRGRRAGDALLGLGRDWWRDHRWTRYRSLMDLLAPWLVRLAKGYDDATEPLPPLIVRGPGDPPPSYRWRDDAQRDFAREATDALVALGRDWRDRGDSFHPGAPHPTAEIGVGPRT